MSESVNGRSHYQSDFDDGEKGIWWCSGYWIIGITSELGQCSGYAYTAEDEKCVHNVGWNWLYSNLGKAWIETGEGLGVRCTGML